MSFLILHVKLELFALRRRRQSTTMSGVLLVVLHHLPNWNDFTKIRSGDTLYTFFGLQGHLLIQMLRQRLIEFWSYSFALFVDGWVWFEMDEGLAGHCEGWLQRSKDERLTTWGCCGRGGGRVVDEVSGWRHTSMTGYRFVSHW